MPPPTSARHRAGPGLLVVAAGLVLAAAPGLPDLPAVGAAVDEPETAEIRGPDVRPGYPDAFALGYELDERSLSPDGRLGLIGGVPHSQVDPDAFRLFLVQVSPFRIVGAVAAPFGPANERTVTWNRDGSAALVVVAGRWGPAEATLLEVRDGRLARQTSLLTRAYDLLDPDYRSCRRASPYSLARPFVAVADDPGAVFVFRADAPRLVTTMVVATTAPRSDPGVDAWEASLEATWDLDQDRFVQPKILRRRCGRGAGGR